MCIYHAVCNGNKILDIMGLMHGLTVHNIIKHLNCIQNMNIITYPRFELATGVVHLFK